MWITKGPSSGNGAPALHCSLTLWSGPRVELTVPKAEAFLAEAERIQQVVSSWTTNTVQFGRMGRYSMTIQQAALLLLNLDEVRHHVGRM